MQINDIDFHREKSEISDVLHLFCGLFSSLSVCSRLCDVSLMSNFSTIFPQIMRSHIFMQDSVIPHLYAGQLCDADISDNVLNLWSKVPCMGGCPHVRLYSLLLIEWIYSGEYWDAYGNCPQGGSYVLVTGGGGSKVPLDLGVWKLQLKKCC